MFTYETTTTTPLPTFREKVSLAVLDAVLRDAHMAAWPPERIASLHAEIVDAIMAREEERGEPSADDS